MTTGVMRPATTADALKVAKFKLVTENVVTSDPLPDPCYDQQFVPAARTDDGPNELSPSDPEE